MKILFSANSFYPLIGGVSTFGQLLTRELARRGHTIEVVTIDRDLQLAEREEWSGVTIHRLPVEDALRANDLALLQIARKRLIEIVRSVQPDVLHLNAMFPFGIIHLLTKNDVKAPAVVSVHAELFEEGAPRTTWFESFFELAGVLTACSDFTLQSTLRNFPNLRMASRVVHHGIETTHHAFPELPSTTTVLCLGRTVVEKGFDLAIEAFARLAPNYPGLRLVVAGSGSELESLRSLATATGFSDRISLPGAVRLDQINALIADSSFVVVPSRCDEGLGIVAIEAAASGRAVIAADAGGLPEVVLGGETGLLFEKEDVGDLTEKMRRLIEDPIASRRLGEGGFRRFHDHFTVARMTDDFEAIYRHVIENAPVPG